MNYLLDTHILLWLRLEPARLSPLHCEIIENPAVLKFISTISVWEISLKFSLGKLDLGGNTPEVFLETALKLGFQLATPETSYFASFHRLPQVKGHRDPFDRMLIWQAVQSDFTLLSHDRQLAGYNIHGLKAE